MPLRQRAFIHIILGFTCLGSCCPHEPSILWVIMALGAHFLCVALHFEENRTVWETLEQLEVTQELGLLWWGRNYRKMPPQDLSLLCWPLVWGWEWEGMAFHPTDIGKFRDHWNQLGSICNCAFENSVTCEKHIRWIPGVICMWFTLWCLSCFQLFDVKVSW